MFLNLLTSVLETTFNTMNSAKASEKRPKPGTQTCPLKQTPALGSLL